MLKTLTTITLALSAVPLHAQVIRREGEPIQPDPSEVSRLTKAVFERWDADGDDLIGLGEFSAGLHQAWTGPSKSLDKEVLDAHWQAWLDTPAPDFAAADKNGNGRLSKDELLVAIRNAHFANSWMGMNDGQMSYDQFNNDIFDAVERMGMSPFEQIADQAAPQNNDYSALEAEQPIIELSKWDPDSLYQDGWNLDAILDKPVFGRDRQEIGSVETLLIASDGRIEALVAEVGGFWDIGDTHVSVPWDEVQFRQDRSVVIPVTEDNVDDYNTNQVLSREAVSDNVETNITKSEIGPNVWRTGRFIGDMARTYVMSNVPAEDGADDKSAKENYSAAPRVTQGPHHSYGYVSDLVFKNDKIAAVLIDPFQAQGGEGLRAYPFYGGDYGWTPDATYYDLPYSNKQTAEQPAFNVERLAAPG
ncbi:PRC-barrel domain-containing protein [Rhizobium sp. L1K21]|uniref:PRC-barrel domain-containing protein n=1 Tax=Rhizobium sp. L1K21 TaxID=2954933 RepID=UPI00209304B0|nr:PRC-barrel domain-containing protein [Rhizobium sp. L1K21]MCO6187767.1 PRC-barrel domain-containing protein [Rhizobium sp. L1K21]